MAYRDDHDALQCRVRELEGELSTANETIARLRGEVAGDAPVRELDRVTGIPKFLYLNHELPFEVSDAGWVAIADLLNERVPGGAISQIGNTLTHRKASYQLRLTRGAGRTSVELKGDYRAARTQLVLGAPGLALLGAVLSAGVATAVSVANYSFMAISAVVGAIAGVALLRWLLKRGMAKDRRHLSGVFESVLAVAAAHARSASNTRIEVTANEQDALAEEEALATEEGVTPIRR